MLSYRQLSTTIALLSLTACGGGGNGSPPPRPTEPKVWLPSATRQLQRQPRAGHYRPFYWEIGDSAAPKVSGSVAPGAPTAERRLTKSKTGFILSVFICGLKKLKLERLRHDRFAP